MFSSVLPNALRFLLATLLWPSNTSSRNILKFDLRHEHAVTPANHIVFANTPTSLRSLSFEVGTSLMRTYHPSSFGAHSEAMRRSLLLAQSSPLDWWDEEVQGPDVNSRKTVLTLATMTYNAYMEPSDREWYELGPDWNQTYPFGWEPEADGFRGHIFVSTDNSTVVISIKGTSASWIFGGGGPTVQRDKLNDNLLFSCCCARVGPTWSTVCNCYSGGYRCDQNCLERALVEESLFYPIGINLYNNVTYLYPDADIWIVGHSLGGALASLVGLTFGVPVVAFEAPGEKLASRRLHLPTPPSTQHITHVYHTADPIAMGTCNGIASTCALAGYAMESRCHLGRSIVFDTVGKLGWSVDIRTHPIKHVIEQVLSRDWDSDNNRGIPTAREEDNCLDCYNWEFGQYKNITHIRN